MSEEPAAITPETLWQPAFDEVWNKISTFIVGPEGRGDAPKCEYNEVFLNGGRGSGKSSVVSTWIWIALTNDPHKCAVVVRKVSRSIRTTCFEQMKKSLGALGLESFWDINKTDMVMTNKVTKQKVIFVGLDDEEKVRSLTTDSKDRYFSIAWFEEAKQFNSYEEIAQAKASILRGGAEMMTFLSYNPPKTTAAWINKEARERNVEGRICHKSTYLTMPPEWLGPEFIRTAESMKKSKPKVYAHMYLGEVTGTGGLYFDNIKVEHISKEFMDACPYKIYGVDFGQNDPNVFCEGYLDEDNGILYIFRGIYQTHLPFKQFGRMIFNMGVGDEYVCCDCQDKAAMAILEDQGVNCFPCKKGPESRKRGGTFLQDLNSIILNDTLPEDMIEELLQYEYKQNPDGTWTDEPGRKADHCVTGDVEVLTDNGYIPILDLVGKCGKLFAYDFEGHIVEANFNDCRMTREDAEIYELELEDGRTLRATADHLVMTTRGWVKMCELTQEDEVLTE